MAQAPVQEGVVSINESSLQIGQKNLLGKPESGPKKFEAATIST